MRSQSALLEVATTFLRLGLTAFGGPAGHIAVMRDELVRRRRWLDDADFVDLVGASNLIPGPTSTELAMHIGHARAGRAGLVVAGLAFLLPAVVLLGVLAWLYVEYGKRPEIEALLAGVGPVVVAIIAHAGWSLARTALRDPLQVALFAGTVAAVLVGVPEIAALLAAGALSVAIRAGLGELGRGGVAGVVAGWGWGWTTAEAGGTATTAAVTATTAAVTAAIGATPLAIFATFLKIGAVLFGSGYVLVALLRSELVGGLGWITERQLIDAVALGQATPGPLFSTATFIGYLVGGPLGAVAATIGVFLPAFVAVALSIPILGRLRASARARAFLDGVNAAAIGLLGVVAAQLAVATIGDVATVVTAVVAFVLLLRGVGTGWLIAGGAAIGLSRMLLAPG